MIYLKEYNRELFYEEIDGDLFNYLEPSDLAPFYDKIKKWLETIKMPNGIHLSHRIEFKAFPKENKLDIIISKIILEDLTQKHHTTISIKVDNDEWFYVMVVFQLRYFKCDQLDGLFQLIMDKIGYKN